MVILYNIWWARNKRVFEDNEVSSIDIIHYAEHIINQTNNNTNNNINKHSNSNHNHNHQSQSNQAKRGNNQQGLINH